MTPESLRFRKMVFHPGGKVVWSKTLKVNVHFQALFIIQALPLSGRQRTVTSLTVLAIENSVDVSQPVKDNLVLVVSV